MTIITTTTTYRIRQLHLLLGAVLGRQQVPHRKQEQKQLNRAPHRVVLVAGLDVPHRNRRPGQALELRIGVVEEACRRILYLVEIHGRQ